MKKINKILPLLLVAALLIGSSVYASFPVKKETKKEQSTNSVDEQKLNSIENLSISAIKANPDSKVSKANSPQASNMDEKLILVLLCVFLGGVAAHRWYAKKPIGWNILFILTGGGCGIWWLIDLIHILTDEF